MKYILLAIIKIYQYTISIDHGILGRLLPFEYRSCIHTPTCSEYGYEAINRFGAIRGSVLTAKRIFRCAPWGTPGYDPVPEKYEKR
mgnify:CR=1 FL=1